MIIEHSVASDEYFVRICREPTTSPEDTNQQTTIVAQYLGMQREQLARLRCPLKTVMADWSRILVALCGNGNEMAVRLILDSPNLHWSKEQLECTKSIVDNIRRQQPYGMSPKLFQLVYEEINTLLWRKIRKLKRKP